jgi:hypothetical protein
MMSKKGKCYQYSQVINVNFLKIFGVLESKDAEEIAELIHRMSIRPSTYLLYNLLNLAEVQKAPSTSRRIIADKLKKHQDQYTDTMLGVALVIPSPLVRGVLVAINWIVGDFKHPADYVKNTATALAKARKYFKNAGLDFPENDIPKWWY